MVIGTAQLFERVAFDEPVQSTGPGRVVSTVWLERHACRAQFIYSRGSEVVEAARLEGRSTFKVRVRSCVAARAVTTCFRVRDTRRFAVNDEGDPIAGCYNIIEADPITDRAWVYLVVQSGKAP